MTDAITSGAQSGKVLFNYSQYTRTTTAVASRSGENSTMAVADRVSLQQGGGEVQLYSENMTVEDMAAMQYDQLRNMVSSLLQEQGIDTRIAIGDSEIDLTDITPEQAQELVADDGYFGVEKTSERIFQFAVGISGGDPSRIDAIKEGVDKGFAEALKAFGGELPQISYDTYDAVMEKLDNWVAEANQAV